MFSVQGVQPNPLLAQLLPLRFDASNSLRTAPAAADCNRAKSEGDHYMKRSRALGILALVTAGPIIVALVRASSAQQTVTEETISGTITSTRVITQNARLTGDVTCTVQAAPCMQLGAPDIKLNLNGFTITGLGD